MSLATVHTNMRSAFRERLLTLVDIDHSPGVSVTLANGVFTRASGSWLTAGFAPGMEVTVGGFTGSPLYGVVESVTALALKTNNTGSQTVAGGGQFVVGLPQGRAFEGLIFNPSDGKPYVAESVRAELSRGLSVGNPDGTGGTIQNIIGASATFFYPKGKGTLAIERMAGACMSLFRRGTRLSYGGDAATIAEVSRSQLYDDGARIGCAVSISIPAYTQN